MNKETRLILENQKSIISALYQLVDSKLLRELLDINWNETEKFLNPKESNELEKRRGRDLE